MFFKSKFISRIKGCFKKALIDLADLLLMFKSRKYILFIVHNEIMLSYVRSIYENIKEDKRLRLWFCFVTPYRFSPERLKNIKKEYDVNSIGYRVAKFLKWDLILFPDHGPFFRKNSHKIYIGHGPGSGKKVNGTSYVYGSRSYGEDNQMIYDKFFSNSEFLKNRIKEWRPDFYSRVKVVGSLLGDEMLKFVPQREKIFSDTGLDQDKKTIMVTSTWGPLSFIQNHGMQFLREVPPILKQYNVILAVHSNNFVEKYSGGVNWRNLLNKTKYKNFFAITDEREPYYLLVNSDILITDMTSLSLYFTRLCRPIIFVENKKAEYDPDALIPVLKQVSYLMDDVSNIRSDIELAFSTFDPEQLRRFSEKVFSYSENSWKRYQHEIYDSLSMLPKA